MIKGYIRCALIFSVLFTACSTMNISSEKTPGTNLRDYNTYAWTPLLSTGVHDQVLNQNIRASLNKALLNNGFVLADRHETPDFYVTYSISSREKLLYHPGDPAWSAPGSWRGFTAVPPSVESYDQGQLVVSFLDGHTRTPFWRGIAETKIDSRQDLMDDINDASQKIIFQYVKDETSKKQSTVS